MNQVVLLMLVLSVTVMGQEEESCDPDTGEVWNDCGSVCTPTCASPYPICISVCDPRCQCPSEKPILHNGICITESECKSCDPDTGEVWNDCGSVCTPTCANPYPICISVCDPRCQCPTEKPILHNGICVPESQCKSCNPDTGEVWNDCGSVCTPTCDNPNPICILICDPRCECPTEKPILHNGICVPESECKSCDPDTGEVWNDCGSVCTPTCAVPHPICILICDPRCQCPSEKPILHNGICITESECNFEANLTKAGWNLGVGRADIMWEDPPTKPKCGPCCDCSALGVLKLTSPSGATGVKMELSLGDPYQYTFYLYSGVSTVNGAGGTSLSNYNDVLQLLKTPISQSSTNIIKEGCLTITIRTDTLSVTGESTTYTSIPGIYDFTSPTTMFLGVNRRPGDDAKWGAGFCAVGITWLY